VKEHSGMEPANGIWKQYKIGLNAHKIKHIRPLQNFINVPKVSVDVEIQGGTLRASLFGLLPAFHRKK
jgi:hypothetical protein